jgi:glutathione peroxidase
MALYDIPIHTLQGADATLGDYAGKTLLLVNVASKCGLTPQYEGLERLQKKYADKDFSVIGFPSNQFMGQEPGTAEEIQEFCSTTYGVDFPLMEKIEVNGEGRHPIYAELTAKEDAEGKAGDITWNFEKFLVSPEGEIVGRYRPQVEPEDAAIVSDIEAQLAS